MQTLKKYAPFFASALLMYVVLLIVYPHYQNYIDPDGTAYLTISKRYAVGDIQRAVNGYWSPLSCWLTAMLIKCGLAAIPASIIVNTIGATGFLFISQSFFLRFNLLSVLQWMFNVTLALFLCFAIFWQSFDDLWECFFLLAALRLMLDISFINRPLEWIMLGVIGTLAYFAKSYSFPFFIVNTIVCVYFIVKGDKKKWSQISFAAILAMVVCSLPWIIALHNKYGIWTTSTAGTLNLSWYLVGHPHWKAGIELILPPTYTDSPSYWEDPYFINGDTPHFWNSAHLFGLQILRVGLNVWKFVDSNIQLSVFFPFIFIIAILSLFHKKVKNFFSSDARVMIISFLIFPLAYFLINFESRYLWYMVPLAMVMAGILLQGLFHRKEYALYILFTVSFLFYPIWGMYKMYDEGKMEFDYAQQVKKNNFHGSFTTLCSPGLEMQRTQRFAYFSELSFYGSPDNKPELIAFTNEMRRYHIKYYFYMAYTAENHSSKSITDEFGKPFLEITPTGCRSTQVWLINP